MPGYMLHLAEGQLILNKLKHKKSFSDAFIQKFMLGCILPDATSDKTLTHFRPEWQKNLITKYPDIHSILVRYQRLLSTPADFGILAHLHMDNLYVASYWKNHFRFEDKLCNETFIHKDIHHVRLLEHNDTIPYTDFFSDNYFYGDYDRCNPYIYHDIKPYIPVSYEINPAEIHITECKNYDSRKLEEDIRKYVTGNMQTGGRLSMRTMTYDSILAFIDYSAENYIHLIT